MFRKVFRCRILGGGGGGGSSSMFHFPDKPFVHLRQKLHMLAVDKQPDLLTGLIGHWAFGDGSEVDLTSSGGSGEITLSNALGWTGCAVSASTSGKFGGCLTTGANRDAYVNSSSAKVFGMDYSGSVSVWVRPAAGALNSPSGNQILTIPSIKAVGHTGWGAGTLPVFLSPNGIKAGFNVDNVDVYLEGAGKVEEGIWHHVAVTWKHDTSTLSLWLDGVLAASTDSLFVNNQASSEDYFGLGCAGVGSWPRIFGEYDELSVWSKVLEKQDVEALWNNGNGLPFERWT